MRDFLKKHRDLYLRFFQEAKLALEDQREKLVTEPTSEVWRQDERAVMRFTSRTESSDWFRKRSNIEKCLENLELLNRLLDQKLIDFDEGEEELLREVRRQNDERANNGAEL